MKDNTILWVILGVLVAGLIAATVSAFLLIPSLRGMIFGGGEIDSPVRTEEMQALLNADNIDEAKVASYSVAWEKTLAADIESKKTENTDLAAADLKAEIEKAGQVMEKLSVLGSLVKGDNHTTINGVALKVQSDLEIAQRYLDSRNPQSKPATSATTTTTASSGGGQTLYVTGNAVRLRVGPGFGYGVYTHVNKGARLTYVSDAGDWYCVNYGGRTLYVSKQFATFSGSSSSASTSSSSSSYSRSSGNTLMITGNGVRLRTGPGENYTIYTKLYKGATLPYVSTSGNWYCVNYGGVYLYVSADYARFI